MQAIRKINNNAAICLDSKGRMLVALGTGVGFGSMPKEVALKDIQHTFYAIDSKYLALIQDLPQREFEFAADLVDQARQMLPYDTSPNLPVTLADHITFAIQRARDHMYIEMPLSNEIRSAYPLEYEIGEMAVRKIEKTFKVRMPRGEAAGIAMHFVNASRMESGEDELLNDNLLQGVVEVVERDMGVVIERDTFDFARFATHVNYLLDRMRDGKPFDTKNALLARAVKNELPREMACVEDIASYLKSKIGQDMTEEEKIYIAMHVTRVCDRLQDPDGRLSF